MTETSIQLLKTTHICIIVLLTQNLSVTDIEPVCSIPAHIAGDFEDTWVETVISAVRVINKQRALGSSPE